MCIRDRSEEGGDDVKSARPLRPGLHTCYNGMYRKQAVCKYGRIPKTCLLYTSWMNFISDRNDDDSFKYLEPMINCLMYFGFDGINYNLSLIHI